MKYDRVDDHHGTIHSDDGDHIATVFAQWDRLDEMDSNGRAMAAALTMLEALMCTSLHLMVRPEVRSPEVSIAIAAMVRDAIALARGEK